MPFITEEIWTKLGEHLPQEPGRPQALIVAPYPEADPDLVDEQAEAEVEAVIEIVRSVRNLRAEFRIQPSQALDIAVDAPGYTEVVESEAPTLRSLGRVEATKIGAGVASAESSDTVSLVLSSGTVAVPLGGLVDLDREMKRLNDELSKLSGHVDSVRARLSDEKFVGRAPEEVVERERQRLEDMEDRRARMSEVLSRLGPR
jgi:valyl-tRNA synthetase